MKAVAGSDDALADCCRRQRQAKCPAPRIWPGHDVREDPRYAAGL
jgi:hypothetical protein